MTGLVFEYYLYDSIAESLVSDFDIYLNATRSYAHGDMVLSQPYLESETILFFNSSLDPNQLENKRHAAIKGGTLPAGVKAENTIYYDNREATLNAVEKGKADYGYGNAYSLAYYALQNGYKNVVTIPKGKEKREYCIGVPKENEVLLSIINKTIASLDENQMQTLILDVASRVERKITFSMIINTYGKEIFSIVFMVIAVLLFSVYSNVRANKRLKLENQKHKLLSNISNECIFEYAIKSGNLELSEKFSETIDVQRKKSEVINLLLDTLDTLSNDAAEENISTIQLPLSDGDMGIFKIIYSNIYDGSRKPHYIIGKLIDISEEIKEKEELLNKAQTDGLTGLYNAATVKGLITASINNKDKNKTDALIIIDCDKFKEINDTFGHLKGDSALTSISEGLRLAFRPNDIIGRIGGDEFCVYMPDVPSADFVRTKCQQLSAYIIKANNDFRITVSIGVAILNEDNTYEDLFKQADDALYFAKKNGGAQTVFHGETGDATIG